MSIRLDFTPADFAFHLIATDGRLYPATVSFVKRLPLLSVNGMGGGMRTDFRDRAGAISIHEVHPQGLRINVNIDAPVFQDICTVADNGDMHVGISEDDKRRSAAYRASGAAFADQVRVALQMAISR